MTTTTAPATAPAAGPDVRRFPWWLTLVLFIAPGVASSLYILLAGPLYGRLGIPEGVALTISPVIVIGELGLLLVLGYRRNGRLSLDGIVGYRRRIGVWRLTGVMVALYAITLGMYLALQPVQGLLETEVFGWVPDWVGEEDTAGLVMLLLGAIVCNGLVEPVIEEMYFRGFLLPRMPVAGFTAIVTNAALFSFQHFWQPEQYVFVFAAQVLLITVMTRFGDLRISMVGHCMVNLTGGALAIAAFAGS